MNEQLVNYIKENLAKGVAQDQIRQTLLTSGWQPADIDAAFLQLNSLQQLKPPQISIKDQKSFLNPKILIAAIVFALLLTAGGSSYFFFFREKLAPSDNQQIGTSETQSQSSFGQNQSLPLIQPKNLSNCVKLNDPKLFPATIGNFKELAPPIVKMDWSQGVYEDSQNKSRTLEIRIASFADGQGQGIELQLREPFLLDDQTLKEKNKDNPNLALNIVTTGDSRLLYTALRENGADQLTGEPIVVESAQVATFWDTTKIEFSFKLEERAKNISKTDPQYLDEVKLLFDQWVGQVCTT